MTNDQDFELERLRKIVRELENALAPLEQRVAERTAEVEAANESLRKDRRVLLRLLDLHDRDRQLTAYEIHDGLVQDMTAALMYFDAATSAMRKQNAAPDDAYQQGAQLLNAIGEARRLINGLRPPVLDEFGWIEAIENHVEELRSRSEIEFEIERDEHFLRLAPVVETALYRIVQEATSNVWRHSGTARAKVTIRQLGQNIELVVRDWGCGFDPQNVKPKRFGLLSIRDRARLLGGEALIESAPGQGTTIRASLPVADVLLPDPDGGPEI